jgi:competence protein ComEC
MLFVWKRSPLLRLAVPLFTGVCLHVFTPLWPVAVVFSLASVGVFVALVLHFSLKVEYGKRHIPGIIFLILFFLFGLTMPQMDVPLRLHHHYTNIDQDAAGYCVKLLDAPVAADGFFKCAAEVNYVIGFHGAYRSTGQIMVQCARDTLLPLPEVDDVLWLRGKADTLKPPLNPGEFDHGSYLRRKGIYGRLYCGPDDWRLDSTSATASFRGWFISVREKLLGSMRANGLAGREYAVLAALLLGKTSDIDKDLMSSYSGAGAIHILAVSGLHVALIYMLLAPLMSRMMPGKRARHIKTIVPVLLLWTYSGITGFSPSVVRAALMFTCFIIADNYQKENNIYNTIGASAMLMMLWNPNVALESGFQLSYLAVLGIVILQQRIAVLYEPGNLIMSKTWKLVAVSVAAQIGTLPYTLYYFDQFPVWFLLTNILVIPLSTVILYCGLASFTLLWWPAGASFVMGLSGVLTRLMNDIMLWIEKLPLAVIDGIDLSVFECVLLTLTIVFFCKWWLWYHSRSLMFALTFCSGLIAFEIADTQRAFEQQQVCIHAVRQGDAVTVTNGTTMHLIADAALLANVHAKNYLLKSYQSALQIEHREEVCLDSLLNTGSGILRIAGGQICVLNELLLKADTLPAAKYHYVPAQLKYHYHKLKNPERFHGCWLVFSAAVSEKTLERWRSALPEDAVCYHLRSGALLLE